MDVVMSLSVHAPLVACCSGAVLGGTAHAGSPDGPSQTSHCLLLPLLIDCHTEHCTPSSALIG